MKKEVVCWCCGNSIDDVPRPIRPSMRCPTCRADLHACRLCRHYDTRYIGDCAHEQADKVLDKKKANYCTYYSPRPDAHSPVRDDNASRAKADLAALFGEEVESGEGSPDGADPLSPSERARREAEALFNLPKQQDKSNDEP